MTNLKSLMKSFMYAFEGLKHCIGNQRNFRIHTLAGITIILLTPFYNFSRVELTVLLLVVAGVMVAEIFNTAIEMTMDKISLEIDPEIKIVKDIAAAGVLMTAFVAVTVGATFFLEKEGLSSIIDFFVENPFYIAFAVLYAILGYLFVFKFKKKKENK